MFKALRRIGLHGHVFVINPVLDGEENEEDAEDGDEGNETMEMKWTTTTEGKGLRRLVQGLQVFLLVLVLPKACQLLARISFFP